MADASGPVLLVVGGDSKRLQWLTHHVTSHWPNAQVTTAPAEEPAALARFVQERTPDAVILQVDFSNEALTSAGLNYMVQMLRAQPNLHSIVLAEHGSELSAVRAMKCGAKDYIPLGRITRDSLLKAVLEATEKTARSNFCRRSPDDAGERYPEHSRAGLRDRQGNLDQQLLFGVSRPKRAAAP